jgi:hypothetical protein
MTFVERFILNHVGNLPAYGWEIILQFLPVIRFVVDTSITNNHRMGIVTIIVICIILLYALYKRWATKVRLEDCGFPTVYWTPRFMNYRPFEGLEDEQKLASSTITKILPRMSKLGGPYGMYGTVYGISTSVIHIAHPIPAKSILNGTTGTTTTISDRSKTVVVAGTTLASSSSSVPATTTTAATRRRSSNIVPVVSSSGASKAPAYNHFKNFCGDGVFTADGNDWKVKRAAVLHCLVRGVTSTGSEMAENLQREANHAADVFCQQIQSLELQQKAATAERIHDKRIDKEGNKDEFSTNVVPLLQRATIGLIYRLITHHDPEWAVVAGKKDLVGGGIQQGGADLSHAETSSVSSEDDDEDNARAASPIRLSKSSSSSSAGSPHHHHHGGQHLLDRYLNAIVRIRMIILAQSRSIWFLLPSWCYRSFSSLYRDEEDTLHPIRVFAYEACKNAQPTSPLYRLAHDDQGPHFSPTTGCVGPSSTSSQQTSSFMPSKNLIDEAITLLFAGQDTSAATLAWTLHLLSLHPDIQDRVADEIRSVMMEGGEVRDGSRIGVVPTVRRTVTKSIIARMPLLDAIIKESMRLYPVAPFIVRRLTDDVVIPDDSPNRGRPIIMPRETIACIWIYGLHRNPEFWNRPNDFIPDRWLDPTLRDIGQSNGAYMPFASGPRNCIGQPLAQIILRTILSRLVIQYEFIDKKLGVDNNEMDSFSLRKDMQAGFTVLPSGGVDLVIRKRHRS